jgi:ABC-type transport system involved in cytochrome bd biosynthesis fused ATPase/permease subunit
MATREIASVIVFGSYIFLVIQALVALLLCQIAILITIAAIGYRAVTTGALYMRSLVNKSGNLSAPRTI